MRRLALIVAPVIALLAVPGTAAAAEVEVADLLADPAAYRDAEITVTGELVGDYGRRNGVVWVQVNGDAYATAPLLAGGELSGGNLGIAARMSRDLFEAGAFEEPGGYRHRGPVVAVTGEWRYHDPDRGGESYLDVSEVVVVAAEQPLEEGVAWLPLSIGLVLLAAAGVLRLRGGRSTRGAS
jgi:hypothetical protein